MLVPSSSSEVYPSAPLFRSIVGVVIIGIAHAAGRSRARARVAAHDRHVLVGGPTERAMVEDDVVDVVASVLLVEDLDAVRLRRVGGIAGTDTAEAEDHVVRREPDRGHVALPRPGQDAL